MDTSKFEKISTVVFARLKGPLPFDVYLQLSDQKYTKIFAADLPIDFERLNGYVLRGVKHFHILKKDRTAFMKLTAELLEEYAKAHDFVKEEAQHILDETAEKVISEILAHTPLSEENLGYSRTVIRSYIDVTGNKVEALPSILKLAKNKKFILRHSIMSSIFATLLARAIEPKDPMFWFNAGLAGFFHDLGMSKISEEIDEHNMTLSPELRKKIERHPKDSILMLGTTEIPTVVKEAILHHHEHWDGSGYPNGLRGEKIPLLARLISIVDQFTGLINSTPTNIGLSPQMAFLALQKSGKFDPNLSMILGRTLNLG